MDECRDLAAWATALPAKPLPASDGYITARIEFMESTLPTRTVDEESGKKRMTVYIAVLRGLSAGALRHMASEACRTLDWFPTPKQCLELAADYIEPVSERDQVLRLCQTFAQAAFEAWLANLIDGQPIGDVPSQWIGIAIERGALRRLANDAVVSRALYQGPYLPIGHRL